MAGLLPGTRPAPMVTAKAGRVRVARHTTPRSAITGVAEICPTGAIVPGPDGAPAVDRGKCMLCGRCVAERPDLFEFDPSFELASVARPALVVPPIRGNRGIFGRSSGRSGPASGCAAPVGPRTPCRRRLRRL